MYIMCNYTVLSDHCWWSPTHSCNPKGDNSKFELFVKKWWIGEMVFVLTIRSIDDFTFNLLRIAILANLPTKWVSTLEKPKNDDKKWNIYGMSYIEPLCSFSHSFWGWSHSFWAFGIGKFRKAFHESKLLLYKRTHNLLAVESFCCRLLSCTSVLR